MPTMMTPCPTCMKPTPHRSTGVHTQLRESDGRVSQEMSCAICNTSTRVYFTEGTNEFQDNLDAPNDTDASETLSLKVRYIHESPLSGGGKQCSNIMWDRTGKWPMKAGVFPAEHPVNRFAKGLAKFRDRGYWVSPFPEGDGFTLDLKKQQSRETAIQDIQECFGWDVTG